MAIKGVIGEKDARTRIAEMKAQVLQAEAELASLDEAPRIITLHPASLNGTSKRSTASLPFRPITPTPKMIAAHSFLISELWSIA